MSIMFSTFKSGKAKGRFYGQFNYAGKDYLNLALANVNSATGSMSDVEGRKASISWTLGQVKMVFRKAFGMHAMFSKNPAGIITLKVCPLSECEQHGYEIEPKEGTKITDLSVVTANDLANLNLPIGDGYLMPQMRLIRKDSKYFENFSDEDFKKYSDSHAAAEVDRKTGDVIGYRKVNLQTGVISTGDLEDEYDVRYSYDTIYVDPTDEVEPTRWVGMGTREENLAFEQKVQGANQNTFHTAITEKQDEHIEEENFKNE